MQRVLEVLPAVSNMALTWKSPLNGGKPRCSLGKVRDTLDVPGHAERRRSSSSAFLLDPGPRDLLTTWKHH